MKFTNLPSYCVAALFISGALSLACGSSNNGSDGSGGSSNGGSGNKSGSSNGGGGNGFDAGSDPNRNKVAPGSLCKRVAEIQCAGEAYCCASPGRDIAACQMAQQTVCGTTLSLDTVAMDPVTGFDMTKSNAAMAQYEMLASKCDTSISAFAIATSGFRGVAAGTVDPGGKCNPDMSAMSRVAATAAALVSCKDPSTNACLPAPSPMDWTCTPRADAGGKCFTDANCKDGLFCDNPNLSLSGSTCGARKENGADCTLPNECKTLACKDGKCADQTKDTAYCLAAGM